MDSDAADGSVFDLSDESEGYVPQKAVAARAAVKKSVLTAGKAKPPAKKRGKSEVADDESVAESSSFSHTPPSSKKQKTVPLPTKKSSGGLPLAELENESMGAAPSKAKTNKSATETYQKLTQLEHIIKRPDAYIGSVEKTEQQMWVFNKENTQMEYRSITFVPGFYKIFDEILVNAADNKQRDSSMTSIKVNIDREGGTISVENNGKGIPVVVHEKEKIYIPELIFGHLLAGSNFDDEEQKTVGGRNGYGAKLCNVFSTEFTLECQDSEHGKRYKQTWTENMQKMHKAKITASKTSDFVRVTFKPDYHRFGMPEGISDDLEALLLRRVYDLVGTVRAVKVFLNRDQIKLKDFKAYCDLYAKSIASKRSAEEGGTPTCTVEIDKDKSHPRWEVGFTVSDGSFQQVSFVNSIATTSGGTHVNYIADQITAALLKALNKKNKGHTLKQSHLRNHIFIFVNCLVNNPAFTSQTKEQLTTKASQFGSKCVLGADFLRKIEKSDAIANIMDFAQKKADKMMSKSDGNKRSRVSNTKLTEANFAGTKRGPECTLILTEGESAKGLALAGRNILDAERIGVFPLRGKLLNVRDAKIDQITKNVEIQSIKQILGLKHKQVYTDTKSLRYGHIMIMTDQDYDGSHIKGLLINFLQVQFPSLLKIPEFLREFITPIMKVWQGPDPKRPKKVKRFFSQPQYEEWREEHKSELSRWDTKYYKGLGTSTNEDAQVYFTNLDEHLKEFEVMKSEEAALFDLAFSKHKADARKEWLGNFVKGTFLEHTSKAISYGDFVNKELILFSMADNIRSIPSVIDGFKPGQRKVLYACFLRNLVKDCKVAELAGFVGEKTKYHHGEVSLQQTIIGLAQDFVGSNNINCLEPSGNFGSRLAGGSNAASPRYIYTRLSAFARKLFCAMDDPVLSHLVEEGRRIEPEAYFPILPMVLVNGADGIGTGWSTSIPNYHPMDIVKNLKRRMGRLDEADPMEKPFETMMPWFRGWKGQIEIAGSDRYKFSGLARVDEQRPNEVLVTELPIRMWTDDFKARLEKIISGVDGPSWIKDYKEFNDHRVVHFEIVLDERSMGKVLEEGLLERFKLTKQVATSNLVAFDTNGQIRKYERVEDILEEYYVLRLAKYTERKDHWLGVYHAEFRKLSNQARFIREIIEGTLVVNKKKKDVLVRELRERKYEAFPPASTGKKKNGEYEERDEDEDAEDDVGAGARDYDYLLSMPIWSLTAERLDKLNDAIVKKKDQHDQLQAKSEKDLWCADLDDFAQEWERQLALEAEIQTSIRRMGRRVSKKIGAGRNRKAKEYDEYAPEKKSKAKAKAPAKVETKSSQRFAEMFGAKPAKAKKEAEETMVNAIDNFSDDDFAALGQSKAKAKAPAKVETKSSQRFAEMFGAKPAKAKKEAEETMVNAIDNFSDDDFAALGQSKAPAARKTQARPSQSQRPSEEPEIGRTKRAAASKAKTMFEVSSESDGDDEEMLGDIGAMVKGIGKSEGDSSRRLSLYAMNRPTSSHGNAGAGALPKLKAKVSKSYMDVDSPDDTNYELLARSSPHKSAANADAVDSLSDDDPIAAPRPLAHRTAAAPPSSPSNTEMMDLPAKKARGRATAAGKSKAKVEPPKKAAPAVTTLSPAAKAYAAKRGTQRKIVESDSDEEIIEEEEEASPVAKPAARGRPGRAAAARRPVVIDEDSSLMLEGGDDDEEESDDPFKVDDDDDDEF